MAGSKYRESGVDIDTLNRTKKKIAALARETWGKEVLSEIGNFGGLFEMPLGLKNPVLVSSVDGVGTKLKVAFLAKKHDTVGEDLVNHCVNDILVQGAEPLFFLDYIAGGDIDPEVVAEVVKGIARGCKENGCALIGGETAQMPGFYQPGEYDVSGTIVGVVEKSRILDGKSIRPGDAVIGLASSGLHTNGYSLARKIFFEEMKLKPRSRVAELGNTIGDELLKVHVSYGPLVQRLLKKFNAGRASRLSSQSRAKAANRDRQDACPTIKALAHITGGGFVDNIPRVLPENCDVVIRKGSWEMLPIFQLIQAKGGVPESELYQVFNMGIGMVVIVAAEKTAEVLGFIGRQGQRAWQIGEVLKGRGEARVV
jgi:phosphoribosylformylglycinamidine cyclo-ligase